MMKTSDPTDTYSRRKSQYWRTVRIRSVAILAPAFLFSCLIVWVELQVNRGGEYCTYVEDGEPYHVLLYGEPCRFTLQNIALMLEPFWIIAIPSQVLFWAYAYHVRKIDTRRRLEP